MKTKRGSAILLVFLLIALGILIYLSYLYFLELNAEPILLVSNTTIGILNQTSYSGQQQFYQNMRFPKKTITYHIGEACSQLKKLRMKQAFSRLEKETGLLKFYETDGGDADILVTCQEIKEEIPGEYFVAGEGGPTEIINASYFYIIEKGKILLLYKKGRCNNYNVELHELLHVFGFKHSTNENSIMYNTSYCHQILTKDIVDSLIKLYSLPELPDLLFSNISALKHSSYLDFEARIVNYGLGDATNIKLDIYVEDKEEKKVKEFSIGQLDYGEGKYLKVTNLKIPRKTKKIKFIISAGDELNKKNNIIEFSVPEK